MKTWREKLREGSHHKKRPGLSTERARCPDRPEWLDGREAEIWDELAPELYRMGLLIEIDASLFGLLCRNEARIEKIIRFTKENGETYMRKYGRHKPVKKVRPETRLLFRMWDAQRTAYNKFGMNPRARYRILGHC